MRISIEVRQEKAEDTGLQLNSYPVLYRGAEGYQYLSVCGQFTEPSCVVPLTLWTSSEGSQPVRIETSGEADKSGKRQE